MTEEKLPAISESDLLPASGVYLDDELFKQMQRAAKMFCSSELVPKEYRNNIANCIIALDMAMRLQVHPLMLMQNMYLIHGKPAFEAKFVIAMVNKYGPYEDGIHFYYSGEENKDSRSCTAWAKRKHTGEVDKCKVSIAVAKAEGWLSKPGSKWKTMPDHMLGYRAASWLA